uniref:cell division protein ZapA n=1 Tax=Eubacterium cellulosolvens TaxID=29322 RepID=UPI000555F445|nr:cell division protein ZapA [[Eubacterium] cellulosolvens]
MAEKHSVKVMIDGKALTLSGFEDEEYLQKVAFYLNNKITELKSSNGYGRLSQDTKSILLALNIADDYFKAKDMVESMEEDIENKDQSAYDIKHDLVTAQMEIEKLRREITKLRGSK